MAATYDFNMTRDQLVNAALRLLGIIKRNVEHPPDYDVTAVAEALNMMMKTWQAEGVGLWLNKQITLYLAYNTESFLLGPSGTHASEDVTETTLSAAAEEDDLTITVTSAIGIADTYNIGIELDDGTRQWTTVNGTLSGTTVTLTAALTDDCASGNTVYVYQTKTQRPLAVNNFILRDPSGNDRVLNPVSRSEYLALSDKDSIGAPNQVYYDPQLTDGKLFIWPTNDNVNNRIIMTIRKPIADFDASTDVPNLPVEWLEAIKYNLASRIAPEYFDDVPEDRMKYLEKLARETKMSAMSFDSEMTSIYFQPYVPDRR